jgi:hypothetical protein
MLRPKEMQHLRIEGRATIERWRIERGEVERQIEATVDPIAEGKCDPSMKSKVDELESRGSRAAANRGLRKTRWNGSGYGKDDDES